jgi:hypothetical protein
MAIISPRNQLDLRCYYLGDSKDDRSPYGQTGTLVGTASVGTGYLVLDGNSDYLTYPDADSNSLFSNNELTLFVWFNVDVLGVLHQTLLSKYDTGDNNRCFRLGIDGSSDVVRYILSPDGLYDATYNFTTTETILPGTDYFVVVTWDRTEYTIYINGADVKSGFYSAGLYQSNQSIAIGAGFISDVADTFFDGTIYQAGMAGRAWTAQQIQNLYLLGKDYRIIESDKELLLSENFGAGRIPDGWSANPSNFSVEYDNSQSKYYLSCLSNDSLAIPTDDWSGSNFADSQVTIAGSPTVTRNSSDVTLAMAAGDGITDIIVRRN